jgi:protocatechuate 3,4-dioxygenase beta subunit
MKLRVFLVMLLFLGVSPMRSFGKSQPQASTEQGATITGRVTLRGEPVSGVLVVVQSDQPYENYRTSSKTDAAGKYRITRIPPGSYSVRANGQAFIGADERQHYGYNITLDRGEIREGLDFSLKRGGVITGRVLEVGGRPVIEERISIKALSENGSQRDYINWEGLGTDDRGVYRIYGLRPGRYKLSVGIGDNSQFSGLRQGQTYYPQTYHPGDTDEAKAGIVEVTEGGEVVGIDIILGARARTFEATGLLVDAETGKPQAGIKWEYAGKGAQNYGQRSDANGRFRITGLMPGRYKVFAGCEGDYYMDPIEFDLTDRDVTGLELKRYRGASISGKVVVEGVNDPAVLGKLSQLSLIASGVGAELDPDGSYYFCGLRPGRVEISAGSVRSPGVRLLRIERDGADLSGGIDVVPGDHLTGVRIVLAHYTGVIRGTVIVSGPVLPEGLRVGIVARRLGDDSEARSLYAVTDERGRFVFEGLSPGDYELFAGSNFRGLRPGVQIPRLNQVLQTVSVAYGTESTVTLQLERIDNKDN